MQQISVSEFYDGDLRKLKTFCTGRNRKYKIKMREINRTESLKVYYAQGRLLISIDIGLWVDKINDNEQRVHLLFLLHLLSNGFLHFSTYIFH